MATMRRYEDLQQSIGTKNGARVDDRTGFLHAQIRPTRTGIMVYRLADGSISRELKHPEDVFDEASLETLKRVVITRGHPRDSRGRPVDVDASNVRRLQVGHGGSTIEREHVGDEDLPRIDTTITDAPTVKAITEDGLDQVSMGYSVDVVDESGMWNGQPYDRRHKNIRYDHLAVALPMGGRGGSTVAVVLDEGDGELVEDENPQRTSTAPKGTRIMSEAAIRTIRLQLDDVGLELDTTAAPFVQAAIAKRDSAIKTLTDANVTATARIAALEGERDAAKAAAATEKTRADAAEAKLAKGAGAPIKATLDVLEKAKRVTAIDEKAIGQLLADADPVAATHKLVVLTVCKDEADAIKEKSAPYFEARFDALVAAAPAARVDHGDPVAAALLQRGSRADANDPAKQLDDTLNLEGDRDPLSFVQAPGIMRVVRS